MRRILVYGMTNNKGGMEAFVMNYFRLFDHNEVMLDFVTDYPSIAYADEITRLGSRIFYIPTRKKNLVGHLLSLRRIFRQHPEYHILYCNVLSANGALALLGTIGIRGLYRIVHSHNNGVKRMWLHRLCRPLVNMLTTRRFACSESAGQFMFGKKYMRRDQVTVIKNAINCSQFQYNIQKRMEIGKELNLSGKFVVGHVGRLCYQKNTLFLIDIFEQVYHMDNQAYLLLVGDGEDRPLIEERIRNLSLQGHVLLTGMSDKVSELMQAMDVFVLPSRFEGFGIVGIEAQAAGLPCIFSDQIIKDVGITNSVEFVSLNEAPTAWAKMILKYKDVMHHDSTQKIIEKGYDIHEQARSLESLFRNL